VRRHVSIISLPRCLRRRARSFPRGSFNKSGARVKRNLFSLCLLPSLALSSSRSVRESERRRCMHQIHRQPLQRRRRAGCILSQQHTRNTYTHPLATSPGAPGVDKFANKRAEWARHNTRDRALPAFLLSSWCMPALLSAARASERARI
jgi:hypothetical protein